MPCGQTNESVLTLKSEAISGNSSKRRTRTFCLSVHPMMNHFIQRFIKERQLGIPCYTFLTDPFPPFWRGWSSPYVDRYFVPTDEALQALTASGIPAWRIERVPMPVRQQFLSTRIADIQGLRNGLQLDDATIIVINGGARGGGPILKIYGSIRKTASEANILVICGRNSRLRWKIERIAGPKDPDVRIPGRCASLYCGWRSCGYQARRIVGL